MHSELTRPLQGKLTSLSKYLSNQILALEVLGDLGSYSSSKQSQAGCQRIPSGSDMTLAFLAPEAFAPEGQISGLRVAYAPRAGNKTSCISEKVSAVTQRCACTLIQAHSHSLLQSHPQPHTRAPANPKHPPLSLIPPTFPNACTLAFTHPEFCILFPTYASAGFLNLFFLEIQENKLPLSLGTE